MISLLFLSPDLHYKPSFRGHEVSARARRNLSLTAFNGV